MRNLLLLFFSVCFLSSCIVLVPFTENEGVKETSSTPYQQYSNPRYNLNPKKNSKINQEVQIYIQQLKDKKDTVRTAAASYLGMMGPAAKEAIPDLIISLNDSSKYVRRACARALGNIGTDARVSLTQLKMATKDKDPWVAHSAQNAIKKIN